MTAPLYTFTIRDPNTIRDDILRTLTAGLRNRGIANPNVLPGSDYYVLAQALANECAVAEANSVIQADQLLPDTAAIDGLTRHATILGLVQRPAGPSAGPCVFNASAASTVVAGAYLTDAAGQQFQTTVTATYNPGDPVPVKAVAGGSATNHNAGDTLTWQFAAPPYAASTMLVGAGGLTGGVDLEDTETFRNRILATYASPPGNGNAQFIINACASASASVQAGFVYPAFEGPATVDVAVVAYPTATSKSRALSATTVSTVVQPYVAGLLPEHVYLKVTPTVDRTLDVSIGLSLPAAPNASPPGPGGGWLDGSPWPAMVQGATAATVSAVTSTTQFTVTTPTPPIVGASSVSWLSPITWTLYNATVTASSTVSAGVYTITVSTPFPGIATGNFIFPTAVNTAGYVATLLQQFALMGPGEKTATAGNLATSYRRPVPQLQWPYSMNAVQLRALTSGFPEILNVQYLATLHAGSAVSPATPPASDPPAVWIPQNIGFYAA